MGGSNWNDDFYKDREDHRKATGTDAFAYNAKVAAAPRESRKIHDKMNILNKIRESRDSAAHPESLAIGVMLDVTGSMQNVPRVVQAKLPALNGLLTKTGYVEHPQILFGAIGDTKSDKGSLQIGQFESGIEMDDDLGNMWLEGGGGGSGEESYENAIYFFANRTSIDCFEKRSKKGYLFILGDELPYPSVAKSEVAKLIGDAPEEDLTVESVVKKCQEKFHIFFLIPQDTSHGRESGLRKRWEDLLGVENVRTLADANSICETIALTIGLCEGKVDLDKGKSDLQAAGVPAALINGVSASLNGLAVKQGRGTASKTVRI